MNNEKPNGLEVTLVTLLALGYVGFCMSIGLGLFLAIRGY
jgi:hypothetical protein